MKHLFILLTLFSLLLSACSAASGASLSASGAQAWLDQPVNGAILPLGAFPLKAHARHVDGSGITRIEFLVNGVTVGAVDTDSAAPIVYAELNWNASAPGEYNLSARAYAGSQSSDSASVRVCVSQEVKQPLLSPNGGCDVPQAPIAETPVTKSGSGGINFFYGFVRADVNRDGVPEGLLDGVQVRVVGCVTPEANFITGLDGRFEFRDLDNGTCLVSVFKPGWERVGTDPAGLRDPVNVIIDASNPDIDEPAPFSIFMAPVGSPSPLTPVPPTAIVIPPTFTPVPPTATLPPPTFTPVPADTTPPVVYITYVDPSTLYYGQGCSAQSGILTVEAFVQDGQSSIGEVYLVYGFTGAGAEGIFVQMSPIGGGYYRAVVDIGAQAYNFFQGANGSIGIAVIGNDSAGNSGDANVPDVPLLFCPG